MRIHRKYILRIYSLLKHYNNRTSLFVSLAMLVLIQQAIQPPDLHLHIIFFLLYQLLLERLRHRQGICKELDIILIPGNHILLLE